VVGAPGAHAIHIFDLGTTEIFDRASISLSKALSYEVSGDVYGEIRVARDGEGVVAVTGRGRLVTGATTPPPFIVFDLHRLGRSPRLAGTITIRDPGTGFVHTLSVNTSAQPVRATEVAGRGIGFDRSHGHPRLVRVQWSVDDAA